MKKKLLLSLVVLSIPLLLSAQDINAEQIESQTNENKKVTFNSSKRDPFISKEESIKLEQMKAEEIRRQKEAEQAAKIAAEKERKKLLRKQILCDEMKRHPSREVRDNIQIDGILDNDVIINGMILSIGSTFSVPIKNQKELENCGLNPNDLKKFKVKILSVAGTTIQFIYKGERFEKKMPLIN